MSYVFYIIHRLPIMLRSVKYCRKNGQVHHNQLLSISYGLMSCTVTIRSERSPESLLLEKESQQRLLRLLMPGHPGTQLQPPFCHFVLCLCILVTFQSEHLFMRLVAYRRLIHSSFGLLFLVSHR